MKTGYEYLRELCAFQADFSARNPQKHPITNRVSYITHVLNKLEVKYSLEYFNAKGYNVPFDLNKPEEIINYVNIVAKFSAPELVNDNHSSIIFLAHHDIANPNSENCNDNTASVANLLHLCSKLKDIEHTLLHDVYVVFTDAEEIVNPNRCGSGYLAKQIHEGKFGDLLYAVNLELTAYGDIVWVDARSWNVSPESKILNKLLNEFPDILLVSTPYNDAGVLRNFEVDSLCLGTLPKDEVEGSKWGMYPTWSLCHSVHDVFENANEQDMANFVEKLLLLI